MAYEAADTEPVLDLIDKVLDYLEILTGLLEQLKEELNAKRIEVRLQNLQRSDENKATEKG